MPKVGCISGTRRSNRLRAILLNVLSVVPVVCLNPPCSGQAARRVTAVRFWSAGDSTRVAVEVSGEFKYKSDNLEAPPRLFFDVQGAKPSMAQKTIPVGDHLLRQIRIAETQPGTTRIVLDLEQNADFNASQLSNPERLIVEIRPKGTKPLTTATDAIEEPARPLPSSPAPPEPKAEPKLVAKTLPSPAMLTPVSRPMAASVPASPAVTVPRKAEIPEPKPAARNSNGERSLTRALGLKLDAWCSIRATAATTPARTVLPPPPRRNWCWTFHSAWRRSCRTGWAARLCSLARPTPMFPSKGGPKSPTTPKRICSCRSTPTRRL